MTEAMTTANPGGEQERPRCRFASSTDHPCWREATSAAHFDPGTPRYCPEHVEAMRLGEKTDEMLFALEELQEWIAAKVRSTHETPLQRHAHTMRETAEAEYWRARVEADAARLIAEQPEHERPLSREQARRLGELMLRADALGEARVTLEDAPDDLFGGVGARWRIVAALQALGDEACREHERYKQEVGLR